MNTHILVPIVLAVLLPALPGDAEPRPTQQVGCEPAARALRQAARYEADAQFWRQFGTRQADSVSSLRETLISAGRRRHAALALAESQHTARLEMCALFGGAAYEPLVVPSAFSATVDHPYFPLVPGRTLVYENHSDGSVERIEVTTLESTVLILGVPCRPVEVVTFDEDEIEERSTNWYSQHADGSVWWFGELTQTYEDGFLTNMDGSWRAGIDGALPGVFVPASFASTAPFRRALAIGSAEEVARVARANVSVSVPFGDFTGGLAIEERDPLEPFELVIEILIWGIGLVAEEDPGSGSRLQLIAIEDRPRTEK